MRQIIVRITIPEAEVDAVQFHDIQDILRAAIEDALRTAIGIYDFQGEAVRFEGEVAPDVMTRLFGQESPQNTQ